MGEIALASNKLQPFLETFGPYITNVAYSHDKETGGVRVSFQLLFPPSTSQVLEKNTTAKGTPVEIVKPENKLPIRSVRQVNQGPLDREQIAHLLEGGDGDLGL